MSVCCMLACIYAVAHQALSLSLTVSSLLFVTSTLKNQELHSRRDRTNNCPQMRDFMLIRCHAQIETFHDRRLRFQPTLSRSRLKYDLLKTALGFKPVPICFRCVFVGIDVTQFDKNASVQLLSTWPRVKQVICRLHCVAYLLCFTIVDVTPVDLLRLCLRL